MTLNLWLWPFRWTLDEQKIIHSGLYTTILKFSPVVPLITEIQAKRWFLRLWCDLWPMTLYVNTWWTKHYPLVVIHHHTTFHSNRSILPRDTGQNSTSKTLIWPLTCDPDYEGEHLNNNNKIFLSWFTSPHQKSFQLVQPSLRFAPDRRSDGRRENSIAPFTP